MLFKKNLITTGITIKSEMDRKLKIQMSKSMMRAIRMDGRTDESIVGLTLITKKLCFKKLSVCYGHMSSYYIKTINECLFYPEFNC